MNEKIKRDLEYIEKLKNERGLTNEIRLENGNVIREHGTLNLEGLIKRLLKTKYITGDK